MAQDNRFALSPRQCPQGPHEVGAANRERITGAARGLGRLGP